MDRVERHHERVTVTRNGKPAVVIISPDDLQEIEETLEVLQDPEAMLEIREALAADDRGDVVEGIEAVRALRPCRMARPPGNTSSALPRRRPVR